jgi:hypothetical protein
MVQTTPPVTVASGPRVNDPASPARRYDAWACAARPRQSASGRCRPPTALPWPPSLLHADAASEPPSPSPVARRADKSHCPPLCPLFTLSLVCVPPRAQPSPLPSSCLLSNPTADVVATPPRIEAAAVATSLP